ncbi:MAG TPA: bifunctional nuclease family protein [Acidimicrobiales bacterium]|nr:bifunctional nuclease family protein [Acidimicrobiales bacterium]
MAGEGGPTPAESLQGPPDGSGGPSGSGDGRHHHDGEGHEGGGPEASGAEAEPGDAALEEGEPAWPPPTEEGSAEPAPMRQVAFMGVGLELPNTNPSVILHEIDPPRRELRITIAQPDGVALAYAWRGIATPRPLTHDLFTTILQRFGLQVDAVRVVGVDGPVFSAELALSGPSGSHTVECRPSDALALALRQPLPVPIMVAEEVLATAGTFQA